jgi:hypothetical protein
LEYGPLDSISYPTKINLLDYFRYLHQSRDARGKKVPAKQIVIQPCLDDPNGARFPDYIGKRYTFVMSDEVRSQVLLIRTEVPGSNMILHIRSRMKR